MKTATYPNWIDKETSTKSNKYQTRKIAAIFKKMEMYLRFSNLPFSSLTLPWLEPAIKLKYKLVTKRLIELRMTNDENTDLLLGLGLSLNQARVYLAILKLEKTTVAQVAKYSKVRREDVYRIMPSLEKMGLIERLMGKPTVIRATPISDSLSFLVAEEKTKSDDRLTGMRGRVQKLSLKDWKQPLPGEESIYILIAEKKAILAKTSELISNSRKEVSLIADKARIIPTLSQFSEERKQAIKKGSQIRLIFEGDSPDVLLKEKVKKLIDGTSVHIKFHPEPLNHFIMSDDKEALITTSKESGLGESPSLWTNNSNLIGVIRKSFESDWKEAED